MSSQFEGTSTASAPLVILGSQRGRDISDHASSSADLEASNTAAGQPPPT